MGKRHHYVQRAYLARFGNSQDRVWQHDFDRCRSREISPVDAAVEKHLYSPLCGSDPKNNSIEDELAKVIEDPGILAIASLSKGESLSQDQRYALAIYLAIQNLRVPPFRDEICDEVNIRAKMFQSLAANHPDYVRGWRKRAGLSISDSDVQQTCTNGLVGNTEFRSTKVPWLNTLDSCNDIAPIIASLPWLVVEAPPRTEFITSDTPVVRVLTNPEVPYDYGCGWLSASAETTFALDPEHVLVIRQDAVEDRIVGRPIWCRDVNHRTIRQAKRFVFSKSNVDFIYSARRNPENA